MPPENRAEDIQSLEWATSRLADVRQRYDRATFQAAFLPMVYGLAAALLPENETAAQNASSAVFELIELRRHRLPRRTLSAAWLLQSTIFAARKERRRLRLPRKATTVAQKALYKLNHLPPKMRDVLLLAALLQIPPPAVAAALRVKESRVGKRLDRGLAKLQRSIGKIGADAGTTLRLIPIPPPPPFAEELRTREPDRRSPRALTRQTLAGWRWLRVRTAFRRALATVGALVTVLLVAGSVLAYLATHGYLNNFFIRMGQREIVKEFPELLEPARPWPVSQRDFAVARTSAPSSPEELFGPTNIWPVTLTFTPGQLKALEPSSVPPIRDIFQDGRVILRNPAASRSGLAGVLGFDFNWSEARLEFAGRDYGPVAVRYRGNGTYLNSLWGAKQSLKLDVNKIENATRVAGVRELNCLNTIVDYSYLHDVMAQEVFRELGAIGPRTAYTYVTIKVQNGQERTEPRGLFVLVENIDGDFAESRFGTKKAPIFKPVTYDLFVDIGDDWAAYEAIYDLKTKASPEQLQRVVDFAKLVSHAPDDEFARRLPEFLDIQEFAAFVAGHVLLSSYDGFLVNGQNFYVYLDPNSNRFGFVPWDQDHGWGDFGHIGTNEQRENASIWNPSTYDFRFLKRVMAVEAFRDAYRQKLETALATFFTQEKLYSRIDAIAAAIRPAVEAESPFRLERFDKAISSQWLPGPRDGVPEGPKAPIHQIKRFIENRIQSVRDQLDGKSEGVRLKGFS